MVPSGDGYEGTVVGKVREERESQFRRLERYAQSRDLVDHSVE